jgi:hypothetical protein
MKSRDGIGMIAEYVPTELQRVTENFKSNK